MTTQFKCAECGNPHTDEEKTDRDWCWPCMEAEMTRSKNEDAVGLVSNLPGALGRLAKGTNATTRSRPPKYMLDPSEYAKYGY